MSTYIKPFTNFSFKKLFASKTNKDLLIDFIKPILQLNMAEIYVEDEAKKYYDCN